MGIASAFTGDLLLFVAAVLAALEHECAHLIAARRYGYVLDRLVLMPYGAVLSGDLAGMTKREEIVVSVAGPLCNGGTALFFVALWWLFPETYPYTETAASISFSLFLVNLLPAFPLDGGRILLVLLRPIGAARARLVCHIVTFFTAAAVLGYFVYTCFSEPSCSAIVFSALLVAGGFGGGAGFGGFEDIFGSIFQGFGGGASMQRDTTGEDIQLEMRLSFMDAAKGCMKDITYSRNEPCPACKGTGAKDGTAFRSCQKCGGKGQVRFTQETMFGRTIRVGACPDCGGRGKIITDKCPDCKGKGYIRRETKITLNIPAGADTNSYIRKRGYGQASTQGGEAGDLIVVFRVEPHKIFQRKNYDLYVDLPVPFLTATLGGTVKVPDLDDAFDYNIPEGTQSGTTFTVRGKGIKTRNGTGNLYLRVFVEVPEKLTREQRAALENARGAFDLKQYEKAKRYSDNLSALYGKEAYKK